MQYLHYPSCLMSGTTIFRGPLTMVSTSITFSWRLPSLMEFCVQTEDTKYYFCPILRKLPSSKLEELCTEFIAEAFMILVLNGAHYYVHLMIFLIPDLFGVDLAVLFMMEQILDLIKPKDDPFVEVADLKHSQVLTSLRHLPQSQIFSLSENSLKGYH